MIWIFVSKMSERKNEQNLCQVRGGGMFKHLNECLWGLFWALLVVLILFVHYTMTVDVPEFRYVEF